MDATWQRQYMCVQTIDNNGIDISLPFQNCCACNPSVSICLWPGSCAPKADSSVLHPPPVRLLLIHYLLAVQSAAVAVSAVIDGARVELPHGLEVGTAIRHTELWAKAFRQACPGCTPEHASSCLTALHPMSMPIGSCLSFGALCLSIRNAVFCQISAGKGDNFIVWIYSKSKN